jgi:hypothetical protein
MVKVVRIARAFLQVGSGRERAVSGPGEDDGPHFGVELQTLHRRSQREQHRD